MGLKEVSGHSLVTYKTCTLVAVASLHRLHSLHSLHAAAKSLARDESMCWRCKHTCPLHVCWFDRHQCVLQTRCLYVCRNEVLQCVCCMSSLRLHFGAIVTCFFPFHLPAALYGRHMACKAAAVGATVCS
jgi:hypothetical protein